MCNISVVPYIVISLEALVNKKLRLSLLCL